MRGARLSALVLLVASSYFGAIDAFCSQSTVFLQGTWSGTITDAGLGTGTLTISIGQKKKTLNGGWSASFEGSGFSGNLKGQTKGTLVVVKLASSQFKKGSGGSNSVATSTGVFGSPPPSTPPATPKPPPTPTGTPVPTASPSPSA